MTLSEILTNYGSYIYAVVIFFGGNWGLKYFGVFKRKEHNFLLFATLWALVFLSIELFVSKTFEAENAIKYVVSYVVVTTVYKAVGQYIFKKTDL